jgi:hypothetical protein
MRRAWDLVLLPFALAWMIILLAMVMLRLAQPDSLTRNIREAHWPPADPLPESWPATGESGRVPDAVPARVGARFN